MSGRPEILSIIVPVYGTSRVVIDRLLAIDLPVAREILVVDDGSTDGTGDMLDAAVRERLPISVRHAQRNAGKGSATREGLHGRAGAPCITFAVNRFLTGITNLLFGAALTDMETCDKVMRTEVARSLGLSADRFEIEAEITARLLRRGYRIHEIPIRFDARSRAQGKKIRWRDGVRAIRVLVPERFRS